MRRCAAVRCAAASATRDKRRDETSGDQQAMDNQTDVARHTPRNEQREGRTATRQTQSRNKK